MNKSELLRKLRDMEHSASELRTVLDMLVDEMSELHDMISELDESEGD
jgi:hypothetical protein